MQTSATTIAADATRLATIGQALAAMVFGFFVVAVVGFSHLEVVHNAAHDARHAAGFPCH